MTPERVLSTAEARRAKVLNSAIATFARTGYHSTTIAHVASHAGISPAYVSKLFASKTKLFVAALQECYSQIIAALGEAAEETGNKSPSELLEAMGGAYAELIADRDLLMLQVHAQAATEIPEIAEAVRKGIAEVTRFVTSRTGAEPQEVQHFIAFGQLCHLLTNLEAFSLEEEWAAILTDGIRHVDQERG